MKKVILAIAFAVSAFAGTIATTSISYGNVEATLEAAGNSATFDTTTTSFRQDVGYAWTNVRAVGYVQLDKYEDSVIADTESNAVSYGVEVDYTHAINDGFNFFIGGLIGKGSKDLGSDGDSVGVNELTFIDTAIRTGVTYDIDSWQIEIGFENKLRNYDSEILSGVSIDMKEKIQTVFIGAGYKF
jgi:hypothetical protein